MPEHRLHKKSSRNHPSSLIFWKTSWAKLLADEVLLEWVTDCCWVISSSCVNFYSLKLVQWYLHDSCQRDSNLSSFLRFFLLNIKKIQLANNHGHHTRLRSIKLWRHWKYLHLQSKRARNYWYSFVFVGISFESAHPPSRRTTIVQILRLIDFVPVIWN